MEGGGHGLAELHEQFVDGMAQFTFDALLGDGHREGRQLVLKDAEFVGEVVTDDIGPGREDLSELDIGGAERRERAQRRRHGRVAPIAQPLKRPGEKAHRAPHQRRRVHRIHDQAHGAGAFQRGAGADQAQKVVRPAHRLDLPA